MKKRPISIFFLSALTLLLGLTGCELEHSDNGKLDGYWHLEQMESLAGGGTTDLHEQLYFWSVQGTLLNVNDRSIVSNGYYFSFVHEGDSLKLSNARENNRDEGDPAVEDAALLLPFGISGLEDGFLIEKLSSGKMILKSSAWRLFFTKF